MTMSRSLMKLKETGPDRSYRQDASPLFIWLDRNYDLICVLRKERRYGWRTLLEVAVEDGVSIRIDSATLIRCRNLWHRISKGRSPHTVTQPLYHPESHEHPLVAPQGEASPSSEPVTAPLVSHDHPASMAPVITPTGVQGVPSLPPRGAPEPPPFEPREYTPEEIAQSEVGILPEFLTLNVGPNGMDLTKIPLLAANSMRRIMQERAFAKEERMRRARLGG